MREREILYSVHTRYTAPASCFSIKYIRIYVLSRLSENLRRKKSKKMYKAAAVFKCTCLSPPPVCGVVLLVRGHTYGG